ncbi:unnamed protein product [Prunus brigantina]
MPENNDGAKVCAEEHGDNFTDGSAGCINNEINNGAEGDDMFLAATLLLLFFNTLAASLRAGHFVDHRVKLSLVMGLNCTNLFGFLSTFSCAGIPQDKSKGKEAPVIPKCRSMSILQTRFSNTRKNKGEDSGPKVVVTVDADENIRRGCQHCSAPSSSSATRSSLPGYIWHGCRHLFTASGSAASRSSSSWNIQHNCLHCPAPSSSAASFYFVGCFLWLGVSWLGAQLPSFLIP